MAAFERPRTVAEGVRHHLRQELLTGALPPGTPLREAEVAARLHVSRTPVREAFRLLAQEGLLTIHANRGARVPDIGVDEAVAAYEVRVRLETMAAGQAARRVANGDAGDAERAVRAATAAITSIPAHDLPGHLDADDAFHATIARLAANPVLVEMIEHLNVRVRRVKIVTRDVNVSDLATRQHAAIADAVLAGDVHRAEAAMAEHVRANLAIVRGRLLGRPDPSDPDPTATETPATETFPSETFPTEQETP